MIRTPTTRYARNGEVSIAYQVLGEGPHELVFIQGFCSHLELMWGDPAYVKAMTTLAAFARVVLYDKRGTGLSDRFAAPPSLDDTVADLRSVITAAGCERPVIVGFSAGGALGALYAATYPQEIAGLVLCEAMQSMRPRPGYLDEVADEANALIDSFREMASQWGQGLLLQFFGPSIAGGAFQRRAVGLFERACASPDSIEALLEDGLQIDVTRILPSIQVPALVLHRRDDIVPIEAGRYFAEHIPGARFVELEGGDHMPWAGDFSPVAREIEHFVRGEAASVDSDRSLATLVFTSVVGADSLAAELGDDGLAGYMGRHDEVIRAEIRRFGGREVKHTGDGFLVVFDGASSAARFALSAVERASGPQVRIRAGIHTGEVRIVSGEIGGASAHVAARVVGEAPAGAILVTQPVRDLAASGGLRFESFGVRELRGVPGDWELHLLIGASSTSADSVDPLEPLKRGERVMVRTTARTPRAARVVSRLVQSLP